MVPQIAGARSPGFVLAGRRNRSTAKYAGSKSGTSRASPSRCSATPIHRHRRLSAILIVGDAGLICSTAASTIGRADPGNIRRLGFKTQDIPLIVNSLATTITRRHCRAQRASSAMVAEARRRRCATAR
jgi:hypothetical protein